MNRKKTLILFALSISLLSVSLIEVSAVPTSPYIKVDPESISDPTKTIGTTFQISIKTDYSGSDVWGYHIRLTFNPAVLAGVSVSNGDLIAGHSSVRFNTDGFNNTEGTLGQTSAWFYYVPPQIPYTTSGPGTLANVTFQVIGYGTSDITLEVDEVTFEVKLMGYDPVLKVYEIINGFFMPENIGHGYFSNKLPGDVDGDRKVDLLDVFDLGKAYGSTGGPPPSSNWNLNCDFNKDNYVNQSDLIEQSNNYGKSV